MIGPDARDPWRGDPLPDPENPYGAKFQDEQMAARPPAGPAADPRIEKIEQALERHHVSADDSMVALKSVAADLARHAEVGPTILTTLIGNITIGTRKQYAEQSSHWTPGQKTENELLQRVWNLAEDSLALIDLLIAAEARHAQTVEALQQQLELARKREFHYEGAIAALRAGSTGQEAT